jgi:fibronectin type 3 domain-containing protein
VEVAVRLGLSSRLKNTVTLNWTASVSPGVTAYNVYRSTQNGSGYTKIANTSQVTYVDASVTSGATYYYVVTAIDAGVESGYSNQAIAVVP